MPLERVLGAEVGAIYRDIHADHGVRMLLGTGVEAFEGGDGGRARAHHRRARARLRLRRRRHRRAAARPSSPPRPGIAIDNGDPRRRAPADQRAGRLRRRRRGQRPASLLRRARSASSTGPTRSTRGPAAARSMLGAPTPFDACRTSSRISTTSAWSTRASPAAGTGSSSAATPPAREFIAFWLAGRPRRGGHERQRLGRRRPDPPAHPRARARRRPAPRRPRYRRSRRSPDGQEASAPTSTTGRLRAPCPPSATVAFAVTRW